MIERRARWIGAAVLVVAVLTVGSTTVRHTPALLGIDSRFMGAAPDRATAWNPFAALDPSRDVLIVYLNGSTTEPKPDACDTSKPGINIPHAAADLAGMTARGLTVRLFAFCTPTKVGGFNQPRGDGVTKVMRRSEDLEALLRFVARTGVPSDRVFLMGQSAGAWASLLVIRRGETPVAGLIGFLPAFAGFDAERLDVWRIERDRQAAFIGEAKRIDALIYGFLGDPYEPPAAMAWLREVPGIRYLTLSGRTIGWVHCDKKFPHATVFKDCFRETQRDEILGFIASRLAGRDE